MRKLIVLAALLVSPVAVFAAPEWSVPVQVAGVQVYSDPGENGGRNEVVVWFASDPFSDGCPYASTLTWYIAGDAAQVGRIVALLTAATLSKNPVKVYRSDTKDCRTNSAGAAGCPNLRGVELTTL